MIGQERSGGWKGSGRSWRSIRIGQIKSADPQNIPETPKFPI